MFIETVPNRSSPPAVLLRESYRDEHGRAQKRTLANLSKLPGDLIGGLRALLKGGTVIGTGPDEIQIERSLPHGHVAAALGTIRKIALDRLILSTTKDEASRRHCDLVVAMIVDRLIAPRSKLGFVRAVDQETAISSLGSYFEGRCCPLARYGHSRDHRGDRPQIVYGLLCTREGLPIAVEVFDGNTADPKTLSSQVQKIKDRFGISRMVLVGDRGMITSARIRDDLKPAGVDWITCLRAPAIQALAAENGPLQLSLFDDRDLAEISAPDLFPGERLIVCRNRDLAAERARKREDLLAATKHELARVQAQVQRKHSALRSPAQIGIAVGAVLNSKKMAKHFDVEVADGYLSWQRRIEQIVEEERLDGIYVIRTSMPAEHLDTAEAVQAYKDLSRVERAFRSMKTVDLEIRPIRHWTAQHVRAHVFLCMLAYHVEWHLREALAPLLFHDTGIDVARAERTSPVAKTEPSEFVKAKKATKRSADGHRVMSFDTLIAHLGTLVRNTMRVSLHSKHRFTLHSKPTSLQEAAFKLLELDPLRVQ